jgi:hypothetical protein
LIGTATVAEIDTLHDTLDELQTSTADVAHSLTNQVTYIRKLDTATNVNTQAVANLSVILKDIVAQSYKNSRKLLEIFYGSIIHFTVRANCTQQTIRISIITNGPAS